ncbi:hypothetical protein [Carnobacterium maltaromaticum]|uniref:hypothetical protein n=1 Tax=Carnobacterium maltaromaticum TaxID=2751 RepID=UPI0039AF2EBC
MNDTKVFGCLNCGARYYKDFDLNEFQQIVLDWLKAQSESDNGDSPLSNTWYMCHLNSISILEKKISDAYSKLTKIQEFQVLQAFAEWGLNQND